jgi:signal transduction histidine kinase
MNGIISQSGIIIVDGSQFFTAELRNPYALSFLDSLGLGLYSNSINFISLLKSFFEALWTESELHQQLEFYNRMQKEFISVAAHELRTPIQPILGLAQILYKKYGSTNEENAQFLSVIIRNAKRLYEITENIIDVARIENHSLVPLKEEVDLTELVEDAISNTKELLSSKGIQVSFTSMVPQVFINADKKRILQVLLNLLNNASRFTDKGEISIKLEIKDNDKNEKSALILIKDTGRGIDSEIFPRLFTKFSSKPAGGTGLGLYIAKSIVEAHDGRIWAENNKDGNGATFCFSIPFAK